MFKTILVPIDLAHSDKGQKYVKLAAQHGDAGAKIILLNVVEDIPGWAAAELPANLQETSTTRAKSELAAIAAESGMDVEVLVRSGHSYKTILDVAKEKKADMIILASHRPGLQDYFLGSTAAKVVRHALCSVLVIR